MTAEHRIQELLAFIYGKPLAERTWPELRARMHDFCRRNPRLRDAATPPAERLTERDAILIAYGDQVSETGRPPLLTLAEFLEKHVGAAISGVHLLPHFPYSSDDGFSVIDYRKVNPSLGDWPDVARLDKSYRLMFDGVVNHISRQSEWFQAFLRGEDPYTDYFIAADLAADLSGVVRPRTSPLLTSVETPHGKRHVWTTFSDDQIDLNFSNPRVLLEMTDVLLFYVEQGAELIRLDAIAYLWKEIGTPCIHLPQTHAVVKLWRAILDEVAPGVMLITETNVPHADNTSYFGDGTDEAQLVYNFALPPLVLHTFHTGNARRLTEWASTLKTPSDETTFFNFIASHDGIGMMPARGLLSEQEIEAVVAQALAHGGKASHRSNPDGSKSVYELNITLYDALNDPKRPDPDVDVRRFLASQAIMLSLAGVPGIYFHSLFGSRNWHEGVAQTSRARTINRQKFGRAELEAKLDDERSVQRRVFDGYRHLLRVRGSHRAFHPNSQQRIILFSDNVFALVRVADSADAIVLCLVNVTDNDQTIPIKLSEFDLPAAMSWRDLLTGESYPIVTGQLSVTLQSYRALWLTPNP